MRPTNGRSNRQWVYLCAILLAACGTTNFNSTWRDPQFAFQGLRKALVIGVVQKYENQRLLEEAYSKSLAERGIKSVLSYQLAHEGSEILEEDWKRMINEEHIQLILISRLVDVEAIEKQVLPDVSAPGSYEYYRNCLQMVKRPFDTTKWKYATLETRVYDSTTNSVVWTGDSRTALNPGFKVDALIREFAQMSINAMYSR